MKQKKTRALLWITLWLCGVICACAVNPLAPKYEIPELQSAATDGRILFKAYKKQRKQPAQDVSLVAAARSKILDFCDFNYQPVVIEGPAGPAVYFIGEADSPSDLVFGKHFKVSGDVVTSSTNKCLAVPPPPPGMSSLAAFITHLQSDYPTEFHVFLSLKYNKKIYVATASGKWIVAGTKITRLAQDDK